MRRKIPEGKEANYLVWAKPKRDPEAFGNVVKEAFAVDLGLTLQKDIADASGIHATYIGSVLKEPEKAEADTILKLLRPLKLRYHKRRILRAWFLETFDVDLDERPRGPFVGDTRRATSSTCFRRAA